MKVKLVVRKLLYQNYSAVLTSNKNTNKLIWLFNSYENKVRIYNERLKKYETN